jgi:hypothetical protein
MLASERDPRGHVLGGFRWASAKDAPWLSRRDRGSLAVFPSGLAHAEGPLSLRHHSFGSRPQDARHAFRGYPVVVG